MVCCLLIQGRNPGLELANAFGVRDSRDRAQNKLFLHSACCNFLYTAPLGGSAPQAATAHCTDNQERRHQRQTFEEEYREFLKKYEIKYDERYVWD